MRYAIAAVLLALTGCSDETTEADRQLAVAEVEANQEPPVEQLIPGPIRYPDIEANDLYGAGCNFVPEGGGMGAIALAQADEGYMKRGEDILRFAADKGSRELPYMAHRKYDGRDYSFTLELEEGMGERSGIETTDYPGILTVTDGKDRIVYRASGLVQCGA